MNDSFQNFFHFLEAIINNQKLNFYESLIVFLIIILIVVVFDTLVVKISTPILKKITQNSKTTWDDTFFKHKVFKSLVHFVSFALMFFLLDVFIEESNTKLKNYAVRAIEILFSVIFLRFSLRLVNAVLEISTKSNSHQSVAYKTFGELIKVIALVIGLIIIVSILFNLNVTSIITSLSAITAVLLLVFRDTILGFIAGLQIASSKTIKIGDWIKVPKYQADGIVNEINLVTAKIQNFDKTMSTVPTYDLISSEVLSYQNMLYSKKRRIKRSIVFNVKSFRFCDEQMLNRFQGYELIADYIQEKIEKIDFSNSNELKDNQLTNIGVFRKYVERYLLKNEHISNEETLMVRQLEPSAKGLPLEVYCFTETSVWVDYEHIQADIFDHLLTAVNYFDLQVVQINIEA